MARAKKASPDWWILLATVALLGIGLIMVFSSSQYVAAYEYGDAYYYLKNQFYAAALGLVALFLAYKVSLRAIKSLSWPVGVVVLILLLFMAVTEYADSAGGAERWLTVGGFRFQPSELSKVALPMALAKLLADKREEIESFKTAFIPSIMMVGVTSVLILAQKDLSSALVVGAAGFIMMFCSGIKGIYLAGTMVLGVLGGVAAIAMEPYRLERVAYWLDPWSDPSDSGLQMVQSLLAFGTGGLSGVGLGASGAKLYYLPARHTDFVFSVLGEELGFIGATFVVLLFVLLIWRGLMVAVRCEDTYASLLALGITASLGVQSLVNLGVVTGLLPVTGVTLPFISYGGTSLVMSLVAAGVLLNLSRYASRP